MAILAFDTTTDLCSVACLNHDKVIGFTEQTSSGRNALKNKNMAAVLIPLMQQCLTTAGTSFEQVEVLMLPCGPGSFTGIRIGFSVMHGLTIVKNYKVFAPTIFDVWANTYKNNKILMLIDNKQGKFYSAEANNGEVNYSASGIVSYEQINSLKDEYEHIICDYSKELFTKPELSIAEQLITLYQTVDMGLYAKQATPYYLHNPAFRKI